MDVTVAGIAEEAARAARVLVVDDETNRSGPTLVGAQRDEQDARRIFERFYRTDSSRTCSSGGSGLGLSIVDSLMRAHGGAVSIKTAPGQGCHFRVSLPRIADVPAHVDSAAQ